MNDIKTNKHNSTLADYGKLPPQAIELEKAVLGACLLEADAINQVIGILAPDSFYTDAHQRIWRAITALYQLQKEIDLLTITEQLKKRGELDAVGGPFYVAQLSNSIGSAAHIEQHARYILEKSIARQIINTSSQSIKEAYEDETDAFELLEQHQHTALSIGESMYANNEQHLTALLKTTEDQLAQPIHHTNTLMGVGSGFPSLDNTTLGFEPGTLTIIAARPSMGKTAFALQLARNMAVHNTPVAFFSLEMTAQKLTYRLVGIQTGISSEHIRKGRLNAEEKLKLSRTGPAAPKHIPH